MRRIVYGLIIVLAILHQDFWWWNDAETLVLGFIPVGLAYHAGVSAAAAILWAMAVKYCWPSHLDDEASDRAGSGFVESGDHA